jgi:hypothetical protein
MPMKITFSGLTLNISNRKESCKDVYQG